MKPRTGCLCLRAILGSLAISWVTSLDSRAADEKTRFWSFQPVRAVSPPAIRDLTRAQSPIDRFILARLEAQGLSPAPVADRRTLLRRATFDLTGLPPTTEEIEEFLADNSPDAFAKVVERLLASPQYGERWGRHWLDVVRYADARDLIQLPTESDFREAWRYRDWVVSALNRDLPYDQFVRQQIAGDLMQPSDANRIDADALVATGLLAIADFVPGDVDKQQMIADYVNDQIDVVGRAFLGLTLACARCHDHKFDPISTEDYYALAGIFFSTRLIPGPVSGNTPLVKVPLLSPVELAALEAGQARDKARLVELSREIGQFGEREYRNSLERRMEAETQRYLLAAWDFVHPPTCQERQTPAAYAATRQLDAAVLSRWIEYFEEPHPHSALMTLRSAADQTAAEKESRNLAEKLREVAANRRASGARDTVSAIPAESEMLRFRADDRRLAKNDAHQVTFWPNRGHASANAAPVSEIKVPVITTIRINETERAVLRFSGNELLQAPGIVPATGSLFVVFRSDPAGVPNQRLIGWEDAAVGQHGLGIMTDGAGAVHAILRRNGANGDVVVPAPTPVPARSEFQVLCLTWGPDGVAVHRNGQSVGKSQGIDSISSDPAITSLRIGGPGSGSSPRFQGDLAELRIYRQPLDEAARSRVEAELTQRWCSDSTEPEKIDPVADLYAELISAQSPFRLEPVEREKLLPEDFRQRLAGLRGELESLQKKKPPEIPRAVVVQEGGPPGTPHEGFRDARVYLRGNPANPGATVPRGVPQVIAGADPPSTLR